MSCAARWRPCPIRRFADPGPAAFGLANPNLDPDDDDPVIVELDRFAEAIRRVAAGGDPDEVYAAVARRPQVLCPELPLGMLLSAGSATHAPSPT
jgi:hypothetical protein